MALKIKEVIKDRGMSINEIADKMGISRIGLSQHINGNPSVDVLERIAKALDVEVWQLFERESKTELTALVEYKGNFYKAETLGGLKEIVKNIELQDPGNSSPVKDVNKKDSVNQNTNGDRPTTKSKKTGSGNRAKPVCQYSLSGEHIKTFNSLKEAAEETGFGKTAIGNCCLGDSKSSGGYQWKYSEE